jgi:hypothetical protein
MFHAKYLSSSSLGFLKEDIFLSVLHGIQSFEHFLKVTTKGTFL